MSPQPPEAPHFTDDYLLCYFTGKLNDGAYQETIEHLSSCSQCQDRAEVLFLAAKKEGVFRERRKNAPKRSRVKRTLENPGFGAAACLVCLLLLGALLLRSADREDIVAAVSSPNLHALADLSIDLTPKGDTTSVVRGAGLRKTGMVSLVRPNRSATLSVQPVLEWSEPQAPTDQKYRLIVADHGGRPVLDTDGAVSPFTVPAGVLVRGDSYVWRVCRYTKEQVTIGDQKTQNRAVVASDVGRFYVLDQALSKKAVGLADLPTEDRMKREMQLGLLDDASRDLSQLHFANRRVHDQYEDAIDQARLDN